MNTQALAPVRSGSGFDPKPLDSALKASQACS
jgi:hypothetical protein